MMNKRDLPFELELGRKLTGRTTPVGIIEGLASAGIGTDLAAIVVGMEEEEFKELLANTDLGEIWARAEAQADVKVCHALFRAACEGNVQAIKTYLALRRPEAFGQTRTAKPPVSEPDNPFGDLKVIG